MSRDARALILHQKYRENSCARCGKHVSSEIRLCGPCFRGWMTFAEKRTQPDWKKAGLTEQKVHEDIEVLWDQFLETPL